MNSNFNRYQLKSITVGLLTSRQQQELKAKMEARYASYAIRAVDIEQRCEKPYVMVFLQVPADRIGEFIDCRSIEASSWAGGHGSAIVEYDVFIIHSIASETQS